MSKEILNEANDYLKSFHNFELVENNGNDLSSLESSSYDICFSGGVFQHIPDRSILENYIYEALRVVKEGGHFMFTFQVWQTNIQGKNRVGAKFSSTWLNKVFKNTNAKIEEICCDPHDPIPHYTVIVKKTSSQFNDSFNTFKVKSVPWRSICWDGLETKKSDYNLMKNGQRKITFYEIE